METHIGRPPKSGDEAMLGRMEIRVSPTEKETYDRAAAFQGMDRSDWVRSILNREAKRVLHKKK